MGRTSKRLDRLEEALEASEEKRRRLKKRVKDLERDLADLEQAFEEALEDDDPEADDDEDAAAGSVAPSGHRELSVPDETWTVARLREAATSRGLTGVSRLGKAGLLGALAAGS